MTGEEEVASNQDQKMNNNNNTKTVCVENEETSEYKMFDEEGQQQDVEKKDKIESATSNTEAEDDDDLVEVDLNRTIKNWKRFITIFGILLVLFAFGPKIKSFGGYKRGSGNSNQCTDDFSTLVGMDANEAIECLQGQYPKFNIVAISEGSAVTMDYREDRIRVFTDKQGRVATTPNIG